MANSDKTETKPNKRGTNPNSLANLNARNGKNGRKEQPKEFKELVKANTVAALEAVIRIMNDDTAKDSDRIKAAELIIDRAYGKSVQPIDADVKADVNIFALPKEVVSLID